MMMDQMNFGGVGPIDLHGDMSSTSWMDGLMNVLQNDLAQESSAAHSPYLSASAGHHSPTDSSYNDGSLSSLESTSSMAVSHNTNTSAANDAWFGFGSSVQQSSGGLTRAAGIDHHYSSGLQGFADQQLQRKQDFQQEISQNTVSGSINSGMTQSTNEGSVANFSRDGSVSSISSCGVTSSGGISNYGGGSMPSGRTSMKPAGEYQFRPTSAQQQQAQASQRQQTPRNSWTSGVQQQERQYQHHEQHLQRPQQQQQQQQQQFHREVVQPTVGAEDEDSGLRLVHLLVACAQSIQRGDVLSAEATVMKINQTLAMTPQQSGPMSRVAAHFAEALTKRLYGVSPNSQEALLVSAGIMPEALSEILHFQFYETCPYLKFAHFTANQAILEAFKGAKHVHVIDFNLNHGLQWPALIQALALRTGGPPVLRLTGIGPPEVGQGDDSLKEIGMSLAQLAESVKVKFEFRGVVANKLDDIKPWMLQVRPGEVVAVNSMMQLHKLLYSDVSNPAGIDDVLRAVRSLNPKIIAVSEHEANHNSSNFLDRFMEALHFYSSMFDSLEASNFASGSSEQMLAEMYLGREICNIVACEGKERVERHEILDQWRIRLRNAGFQQTYMGPNAFKQASMLLNLFSRQGYRVQDNQGCLTLCWHDRPLIAASAWHCA